ncbi:MAG: DUF4330 family protein [Ruminococcaceae bacterium]|nr:DUF4330 family protein [Oscillospiraceae bacterium]
MKERRGNVLDLFLILLLAFSLIGVIGRMAEGGVSSAAEEEALIDIYVPATEARLFECLEIGETLYLGSGEYYGVLTEIGVFPAQVRLEKDGRVYLGAWDADGPKDLVFTVRVKGAFRDAVFHREGRESLLVGDGVSLYGTRAHISGRVSGVERAEKD